jgi:excisionase family DNA binding protein
MKTTFSRQKGESAMTALEQKLITSTEDEQPALKKIGEVLKSEVRVPKLIGPQGEEITLPLSLFYVLRQVIYHMTHGRAINIVPISKELTTQEAADILNVSRPYLIKLLEQKSIPFHKVGTHRRILFSDLMEYKKQRDTDRRSGLAEITRISEEEGLYD